MNNFERHAWTVRMRRLLMRRDSRCIYCRRDLTGGRRGRSPTLEHVLPRSRGATNGPGNVARACHRCNKRKADRPLWAVRIAAVPGEGVLSFPRNIGKRMRRAMNEGRSVMEEAERALLAARELCIEERTYGELTRSLYWLRKASRRNARLLGDQAPPSSIPAGAESERSRASHSGAAGSRTQSPDCHAPEPAPPPLVATEA